MSSPYGVTIYSPVISKNIIRQMREEINFYFVEYSIFKGNILERHLWIV